MRILPQIFLLILLLVSFPAFSAKNITKDSLVVRKDSLKEEEIEENLEEDNANDTVVQGTTILPFDVNSVPAANIYPCWNNLLVNPYHIALDNYADSTFIDVSGYVHPIVGRITSDFGFRRWRYHFGTDIKLQIGDSLHASFDGMIRIAKKGKGFGNYIVIRHSNGLETVYGHLSKILVNVNQPVKAGQIIGLGGNTGRSTGPHLHYEVRYLGNNINPHDLVDFQNNCTICNNLKICHNNFAYLAELHKMRFYVVRNGDTLSKIARRYGVSVSTLRRLNGLKNGKLIRKGQRLRYT